MSTSPPPHSPSVDESSSSRQQGLLLGALGMLGFSFTLPMTRIALVDFHPVVVGLGRAVIASFLAGTILLIRKESFPGRRHLKALITVALGVVVLFPFLTSLALRWVPASHGAIVVALLPLATALAAVWRAHERPSRGFWWASFAGSSAVILFALSESGWKLEPADGILLLAVAACSVGYAEGGRLAREIGGFSVIAWALLLAAPVLAIPVGWTIWRGGLSGSIEAWGALSYVTIISVFLGFWAWYIGLARGGVARVSQLQLLQPFLTLVWAHLLLGEKITPLMAGVAVFVVGAVAIGRRASIQRRPQPL